MAVTGTYSSLRITLHWVVVGLIVLQFLLKQGMVSTMEAVRVGETPDTLDYLLGMLHLLNGLAIGSIMIWRLILRIKAARIAMPAVAVCWQDRLALAVHRLFYATLIFLPLTGLLAYYDIATGHVLHHYGQWLLLLLVFLHLAGVAYHQFRLRDQTLQRMLRR